MSWIALARQNVSPKDASVLMKCDVRQAIRRLDEARDKAVQLVLEESRATTHQQDAAVCLLTHSGFAKPALGRQCWTDVVLGLKRAA